MVAYTNPQQRKKEENYRLRRRERTDQVYWSLQSMYKFSSITMGLKTREMTSLGNFRTTLLSLHNLESFKTFTEITD